MRQKTNSTATSTAKAAGTSIAAQRSPPSLRGDQRLVERGKQAGSLPPHVKLVRAVRGTRAAVIRRALRAPDLARARRARRHVPLEARELRPGEAAVAHRFRLEQPGARRGLHGSSPSPSARRSSRRAACNRVHTVPIGIRSAAAISAQLISSASAIRKVTRLFSLIRRSARSTSLRACSAGRGSTAVALCTAEARKGARQAAEGPAPPPKELDRDPDQPRAARRRGRRSARRSLPRPERSRAPGRRRPRRRTWRGRRNAGPARGSDRRARRARRSRRRASRLHDLGIGHLRDVACRGAGSSLRRSSWRPHGGADGETQRPER